jgi:hypothetical protein
MFSRVITSQHLWHRHCFVVLEVQDANNKRKRNFTVLDMMVVAVSN